MIAGADAAALRAAPTLTEPSAQIVATSFNPPLDRPLTFRQSKEVTRRGRTTLVRSSVELVFSRGGDGYRVQVRPKDYEVAGADPAAAREFRRLAEQLQRPYVVLLDETGSILGLEDEEQYWAETLRRTEQTIAAAERADTPEERAALSRVMEIFRGMPREARLTMLTEAVSPIFEFGAAEVTIGQALSAPVETASPLGGTVTMDVEVTPERVADGHLFVTMRGSIDGDEAIRVFERFASQIPVTGRGSNTEEERARSIEQLRQTGLSRHFDANYEIALATGLTRRMRLVDRMQAGAGGPEGEQTTIVTLEQVE